MQLGGGGRLRAPPSGLGTQSRGAGTQSRATPVPAGWPGGGRSNGTRRPQHVRLGALPDAWPAASLQSRRVGPSRGAQGAAARCAGAQRQCAPRRPDTPPGPGPNAPVREASQPPAAAWRAPNPTTPLHVFPFTARSPQKASPLQARVLGGGAGRCRGTVPSGCSGGPTAQLGDPPGTCAVSTSLSSPGRVPLVAAPRRQVSRVFPGHPVHPNRLVQSQLFWKSSSLGKITWRTDPQTSSHPCSC